jgi:hypothetical protein
MKAFKLGTLSKACYEIRNTRRLGSPHSSLLLCVYVIKSYIYGTFNVSLHAFIEVMMKLSIALCIE